MCGTLTDTHPHTLPKQTTRKPYWNKQKINENVCGWSSSYHLFYVWFSRGRSSMFALAMKSSRSSRVCVCSGFRSNKNHPPQKKKPQTQQNAQHMPLSPTNTSFAYIRIQMLGIIPSRTLYGAYPENHTCVPCVHHRFDTMTHASRNIRPSARADLFVWEGTNTRASLYIFGITYTHIIPKI